MTAPPDVETLLAALDRRIRARRMTGMPSGTPGVDVERMLETLSRLAAGTALAGYAAPYLKDDERAARAALKRLGNVPLRAFGRPQAWMNRAMVDALGASARALETTLRTQAASLDTLARHDERLERLGAGEPESPRLTTPADDGGPLRIGIVSRTYPPSPKLGGIGRHADELARALHRLGHEVHVFTEEGGATSDGPEVHRVTPELVPIAPDRPRTDRILRWAVAVNGAVEALAARGVPLDVVESHSWESESLGVLRAGRVPVIVRVATPLVMVARESSWPASMDLDTAVALERWIIEHADGMSHSTGAIRATIEQEMGAVVPDERRACIPYGVPAPPDAPASPAGPPRLLFVGRLEPRKGIDTLLAIVPGLLARHPDLVVDIVGQDMPWPGTTIPVGRRFAAAYPSLSRCRFHGVVDDARLIAFYRDCTIFVAPSRYESFGLIYLEAMRWGKPVVGCRAGGIPEVVSDGETGLLVPPGDADALDAAIARLLDDPALRARLGVRARAAVESEFSLTCMAERTVELYRRTMRRRTTSG